MEESMPDLNTVDARCAFTYADRRRCRMLRSEEHASLCLHHARREALDEGRLPPELPSLVAAGALDNPWSVRRTLKRLFGEVAAGKISPERAHAMTYLCRFLLVHTRRESRQRRAARRKSRATRTSLDARRSNQ